MLCDLTLAYRRTLHAVGCANSERREQAIRRAALKSPRIARLAWNRRRRNIAPKRLRDVLRANAILKADRRRRIMLASSL